MFRPDRALLRILLHNQRVLNSTLSIPTSIPHILLLNAAIAI